MLELRDDGRFCYVLPQTQTKLITESFFSRLGPVQPEKSGSHSRKRTWNRRKKSTRRRWSRSRRRKSRSRSHSRRPELEEKKSNQDCDTKVKWEKKKKVDGSRREEDRSDDEND